MINEFKNFMKVSMFHNLKKNSFRNQILSDRKGLSSMEHFHRDGVHQTRAHLPCQPSFMEKPA